MYIHILKEISRLCDSVKGLIISVSRFLVIRCNNYDGSYLGHNCGTTCKLPPVDVVYMLVAVMVGYKVGFTRICSMRLYSDPGKS